MALLAAPHASHKSCVFKGLQRLARRRQERMLHGGLESSHGSPELTNFGFRISDCGLNGKRARSEPRPQGSGTLRTAAIRRKANGNDASRKAAKTPRTAGDLGNGNGNPNGAGNRPPLGNAECGMRNERQTATTPHAKPQGRQERLSGGKHRP